MDLRINELGFQGKKEILYGLTKAADNIQSYSLHNQPRILRLGENRNLSKYQTAAIAYLDMVTKDSEFVQTVQKLNAKDLFSIREILKPIENIVKPLEYFKQFLNDTMKRNGENSASKRNAVKILMEKLS